MNKDLYLLAMDRLDDMKSENRKLAAALGMESAARTTLMDNTNALLHTLTSDAATDIPPILKMAVNTFLRLHPEVAPK